MHTTQRAAMCTSLMPVLQNAYRVRWWGESEVGYTLPDVTDVSTLHNQTR
ncbi:hypothetical protein AB205_0221990 [Aquarana catesbeiana]|uniref:Uncharacterized protein n=1 Tax=Aquarana catesbeiana TaxID=8400 RepID=A0A2G9RDP6_AQUCT|nr:hypothetical protein AB205_0221990 [Aquarana catesbeiana]